MAKKLKRDLPKLCVFCQHCESHLEGYDTSGYYAVVECGKGHWSSVNGMPGPETQFRAETCPDYEEVKQ